MYWPAGTIQRLTLALTGIICTLQAADAIELAAGIGESPAGRLLIFDALASRWRTLRRARNPDRVRRAKPGAL